MENTRKTIYLPVEIKARELSSKILLSVIAAKNGFRVYLGTKPAINKIVMEKKNANGIYLYKGGLSLVDLKNIKSKVDHFVVLDEEMGPAVTNLDQNYRGRIYPGTDDMIDRLFLIGASHLKSLERVRPVLARKAVVTGWPRIDLWRPQFKSQFDLEMKTIKDKFGDYLLFSSDFGVVDEVMMAHEVKRIKLSDYDEGGQHLFINQLGAALSDFKDFVAWLRKVDALPDFPPVIVRPHPSEDISTWHASLSGLEKTKVIYEGEISPWLYSSRGLLHRGCTTAVQAYFAGIPSVYVVGKHSLPKKETLPFRISHVATDDEQAIFLAKKIFNGNFDAKIDIGYLSEIHTEGDLACLRIVRELSFLLTNSEPEFSPNFIFKLKNMAVGNFIEWAASKSFGPMKRQRKKIMRKTPGGIHFNEVNSILIKMGVSDGVVINEIFHNAISIENGAG